MCGIVGYVGPESCYPILLDGLQRLEYRGYDSAGTAIFSDNAVVVHRSEGKLIRLSAQLQEAKPAGTVGIGHTRWATHGQPNERNAHPHQYGRVTIVHNGIIENHRDLREQLRSQGHQFSSETDSEIIAHLADASLKNESDPAKALRAAFCQLRGAYAVCALVAGVTDTIFVARHDAPLIIGIGEGENFVASDIPAILNRTRDIIFLHDGDFATVTAQQVNVCQLDGTPLTRKSERILWDPILAEKEGYKHFMLKEIHEQPRAITDTLRGRLSPSQGAVYLDDITLDVSTLSRIVIVACGTSYHSALVAKFYIEQLAKLPTEVDLASEFRYRDPLISSSDLVLGISQSGETADTLAALREAKRKGATTLSIVNAIGSTMSRETDFVLYTHAGPEIGVASTKAFTTQLVSLLLLAIYVGRERKTLSAQKATELIDALVQLPEWIKAVLNRSNAIDAIARKHLNARDVLFLGRGITYPIALEGALKLKEISYIHAEGYPGGEIKHGPIALVDESLPVVVIAPQGTGYEKIVNNLVEVRARQGQIIAVVTEGDTQIKEMTSDTFSLPDVPVELQPIIAVVPLQLLAYRIADLRGTDVDQPRNLAKSVTVE